jgi:hypothetical protein
MAKKIKTKKRYNKKIKISKDRIGRDLVQDKIGTNQILDYNELISYTYKPDIRFDLPSYNKYVNNFNEQKMNQQYGGDPNEQYQLKKASKQLYKNLRDSLFDEYIPFTSKKIKSNLSESEFEIKLRTQTLDNVKRKSNKLKPSINQILDTFLVNKSESMKDQIITPEIILKWRNKFDKIDGFKENKDLSDNFSTIALSYFDDTNQKVLLDRNKLFLKNYDKKRKEENDLKMAEVYRILQNQQKNERNEKLRIEKELKKKDDKEKKFKKEFNLYESNPDYMRIKKIYLENDKFNIASSRKYLNMVKYSNNGEIKKTSLPKKRKLDEELKKYE